MKTAISVPDDTFEQVERSAKSLGVTRSEFYARAARYYLEHLANESLTDEIDAAIDLLEGEADDSSDVAVAAGRRTLAADEW